MTLSQPATMKPPQFKIGDRVEVRENEGVITGGRDESGFFFTATIIGFELDPFIRIAVEDEDGDIFHCHPNELRPMPTITQITGTCAWDGCDKPATHIAAGAGSGWGAIKGHEKPACYCKSHAESVQAEGISEYHIKCPNCRFLFQC